jgi:recombination protein RecR
MALHHSFEDLVANFKKLPNVGTKSAERMAYAIIDWSPNEVEEFINNLKAIKAKISSCPTCGALMDSNSCSFCNNLERDNSILAIVTTTKDIFALERSKQYHGLYHVLNGSISTQSNAILNIDVPKLIKRIKDNEFKEIILATNLTFEGETTALYIAKQLEGFNLNITRLAYGLPVGAHIDYADDFSLSKALSGRKTIN